MCIDDHERIVPIHQLLDERDSRDPALEELHAFSDPLTLQPMQR
jgi:hypothetical protein